MNTLLVFLALFTNVAYAASAPPVVYSTTTAPAIISAYAAKYGIPAQPLIDTLYCESGFKANAWNKADPNGGSKGVAQFQEKTFAHFAQLAGIENPDIWNPLQQIQTASYMFSIGEQDHWTCYNLLYGS